MSFGGIGWIGSFLALLALAVSPGFAAEPEMIREAEWESRNAVLRGPKSLSLAITPTLPAGKTITRQITIESRGKRGAAELRASARLIADRRPRRPIETRSAFQFSASNGRVQVPLTLALPDAPENTSLYLTLIVVQGNRELGRRVLPYVLVPAGRNADRVRYEGRDEATQGNWTGKYGKQAFSISLKDGRSGFGIGGVELLRGAEPPAGHRDDDGHNHQNESQQAIHVWAKADSVADPRVPVRGPGMKERSPAAFLARGEPLLMRVKTSDGRPHRLSLYLLDYDKKGRAADIDLYDRNGNRLDTRRVERYGNGVYIRYLFTGNLSLRITSRTADFPILSAWFVDPAPSDAFDRPLAK